MGPVWFFLFCIGILGFNLLRYFRVISLPMSHVLLPYQKGFLYRRGVPIREAGPGRHRVFAGREKILFLDINISAKVSDVRKATYASPTYTQMPAFATLCAVRSMLNVQLSRDIAAGRRTVEEKIAGACRERLAASGFELLAFQLTQLGVVAPSPAQN